MREREAINVLALAERFQKVNVVANAASVRLFLRGEEIEATEQRVNHLLSYLHDRYGWRTDNSRWAKILHRAPSATVADCMNFCAEWGIRLRPDDDVRIPRDPPRKKGPSYKGVPDLLDYVKRAAKKCGVVQGYRWHYYGLPF